MTNHEGAILMTTKRMRAMYLATVFLILAGAMFALAGNGVFMGGVLVASVVTLAKAEALRQRRHWELAAAMRRHPAGRAR